MGGGCWAELLGEECYAKAQQVPIVYNVVGVVGEVPRVAVSIRCAEYAAANNYRHGAEVAGAQGRVPRCRF